MLGHGGGGDGGPGADGEAAQLPAWRRRWVWGALGPLPVGALSVTPRGRNEVLRVPEEKGSRTRLWLIF